MELFPKTRKIRLHPANAVVSLILLQNRVFGFPRNLKFRDCDFRDLGFWNIKLFKDFSFRDFDF